MINVQTILPIRKIVMLLVAGCFYAVPGLSQEKENGINVGVTYPVSSLGVHSKEYSNTFSINALIGISRRETAFAVSGLANIIKEKASGFQAAGILNRVGDSVTGFTCAGLANFYKDGDGVQAAGMANFSNGNVKGTQVAGLMNTAHAIVGVQCSGFINLADSSNGTQVAGFVNIAGDVDGTQVAGFINMAKKVKGVQLSGFINLADSSEYPIGIINLVANGEQYLGVTVDDNLSTLVTFRSGSKKIYGIVGVGYTFKNKKEVIALQYGLGAHLIRRDRFRLNAEGTVTHLENFGKGDFFKTSLTVMPAIKLSNRLELFGGPSLNYVSTTSTDGRALVDHYLWKHTSNKDNNHVYGMYVGYTAGLHFLL